MKKTFVGQKKGNTDSLSVERRILPEGNFFGNKEDDEFTCLLGEKCGVFKRFEYLSVPFSFMGKQQLFKSLLDNATESSSFQKELQNNDSARILCEDFLSHMESSSTFSKQVIDYLLSNAFWNDFILARMPETTDLNENLARIAVVWKNLADFYCIEGLVGGDGDNNPFTASQSESFVSGGLDSLEGVLPSLRNHLDKDDWMGVCLKLSSVIERDYLQIDEAVNVLESQFGTVFISEQDALSYIDLTDKLAHVELNNSADVGKFYNAFIRFHNWLPLSLTAEDVSGSTYDSLCAPIKSVLTTIDERILSKLSDIVDATSPKGLALLELTNQGLLGDKEIILERMAELEIDSMKLLSVEQSSFKKVGFEDHFFYSASTGGKWKGLKLLHDAKNAFSLNFKVPKGYAIPSSFINKFLEGEGVMDVLQGCEYNLNDHNVELIRNILDNSHFEFDNDSVPFHDVIVRSSMYGEDSFSNFSGTYESFFCEGDIGKSITKVICSYFTDEAIKSREDIGLSHSPGIGVIVQERIEGRGGVMYLSKDSCTLSFADSPEEAVLGKGSSSFSTSITAALENTSLFSYKADFIKLHDVFGDIDVEFVIDKEDNLYLIQMRPKYYFFEKENIDLSFDTISFSCLDDLSRDLEKEYIVKMDFLGRENLMGEENKIMEFIRRNRDYVVAVIGRMPGVAHIPNKIEGHFRIPYLEFEK